MKAKLIDKKCPQCHGYMVSHPDYKKPYCGSWEYMEGGCPPAPIPKRDAMTSVTRKQ